MGGPTAGTNLAPHKVPKMSSINSPTVPVDLPKVAATKRYAARCLCWASLFVCLTNTTFCLVFPSLAPIPVPALPPSLSLARYLAPYLAPSQLTAYPHTESTC